MRISLKAMVIAGAMLWGGAMLLVGLINLVDPNYGVNFLQMTNSVYPWFHTMHSWPGVLGRTVEGVIDGAIAGILFAWLYNTFAARHDFPSKPQ